MCLFQPRIKSYFIDILVQAELTLKKATSKSRTPVIM